MEIPPATPGSKENTPASEESSPWTQIIAHLDAVELVALTDNWMNVEIRKYQRKLVYPPAYTHFSSWLRWLREEGYKQSWREGWDRWRVMGQTNGVIPPYNHTFIHELIENANRKNPFLYATMMPETSSAEAEIYLLIDRASVTTFRELCRNNKVITPETEGLIYWIDWLAAEGASYHAIRARTALDLIVKEIRTQLDFAHQAA